MRRRTSAAVTEAEGGEADATAARTHLVFEASNIELNDEGNASVERRRGMQHGRMALLITVRGES